MSKQAITLQDFLSNPSNYTSLLLEGQNISDDDCTKIASVLRTNKTITSIHLPRNQIGDASVAILLAGLKDNLKVTHLNLQNNQISNKGAIIIGEYLKDNTTITALYLNQNQVGDDGVRSIAASLKINKTLTTLFLNLNQISDIGIISLAHSLKVNKTLSKLYLDHNEIGDIGMGHLADSLKFNKAINTLILNNNKIGDIGATKIAYCLKDNRTITKLLLNSNKIGDIGGASIAYCLLDNKAITTLLLSSNQIGAQVLELLESNWQGKSGGLKLIGQRVTMESSIREVAEKAVLVGLEDEENKIIKNSKELPNPQKQSHVYSSEEIIKLISIQLEGKAQIKVIDLEQRKMKAEEVEELIRPTLEEDQTVIVAIHLHDQAYAGMVIKKQDGNLQVIYNDPRGLPFVQMKNMKALIYMIRDLEDTASTIDLRQNQQSTDSDSAAFTVDNLVVLANSDTGCLKKPELQKLLPVSAQINSIKGKHLLIDDTNPWYSNDKLEKIIEISLKGKQIIIAPITVFESKDLLIQNVETAAKEVIVKGIPAIVPIHIHGNHWTGLVIKNQTEGGLQVIYNDPKGSALVLEKNSGALFKAIGKVNSNFHVIDLRQKQQTNDDDCGPFTIENLITLAVNDTIGCSQAELHLLLLNSEGGEVATTLRAKHANLLRHEGIPVPEIKIKPIKYISIEEIISNNVELQIPLIANIDVAKFKEIEADHTKAIGDIIEFNDTQ